MKKKKHDIIKFNTRDIPAAMINITRYTYDAWMQTYPESNKEEWEKVASPDDPFEYAYSIRERLRLRQDQNLRIVTLDEEFFAWLKENGLENSEETRIKYINEVSDEAALRLLNKQEYNKPVYLFGISLTVSSFPDPIEEKEIELSSDIRNGLRNYFEALFGEGNVFVSKYFVKPDVLMEDYEHFEAMAESFFNHEMDVTVSKYRDVKIGPDTNLVRLYIPIGIRIVRESAIFMDEDVVSEKEVVQTYPDLLLLEKETMAKAGFENRENFEDTEGVKRIKSLFGASDVEVAPFLVDLLDIDEIEEEFVDVLKKEIKKQGKKLELV